MKERLIELMELLHLTPTQFANAINVQRATLQHILNGRNEPSLKFMMAIHKAYPDIELEWLLDGKGSAIPGLQDNVRQEPDYPLLPGMDSIFLDDVRKTPDFSSLREEDSLQKQRKKRNNKEVTPLTDTPKPLKEKTIKEVMVFFDDGTYQKFSSELKK